MPEYKASRPEDVQRMQEKLRSIYTQLLDPINASAEMAGFRNSLQEQAKQFNVALGRGGDIGQVYKDLDTVKQGGDKLDVTKAFALNAGQGGQTPTAGGAAAPNIGGRPVGLDAAGQNPYSYIINPSAYQYGGKQGMAEAERDRFGGLATTAGEAAKGYEGQYQQGFAQSGQSREEQMRGLGMLRGIAEGTGPSAAQAQMNQGLTAARNQQASIAASARGGGGNLAAAQAASAQAAGQLGMQGIQASSTLRAQEQLGAMGQYGQLAGQMREGDFDTARLGASQQLASQAQQAQWEQYRQAVMAQQQGYQQGAEQQNLAREGAIRGWEIAQNQQQAQEQAAWIQAGAGLVSGLAGLAGNFRAPNKTP